jgi:AcrR family transcriptional regulator
VNGTTRDSSTVGRVLAVAAELLVARGYAAVSIAEIAATARCSTATIYEMFETKERLCREALHDLQRREPTPRLDAEGPDDEALPAVLDYAMARIGYLSSIRIRGMLLASMLWAEQSREGMRALFRERDQAARLIRAIAAATRAGHIRPAGDPAATGYCLLAAITYEPLMMNLHCFPQVDATALLRTALAPFLTPAGEAVLQAWERHRGAAADTAGPARWTYLDAVE